MILLVAFALLLLPVVLLATVVWPMDCCFFYSSCIQVWLNSFEEWGFFRILFIFDPPILECSGTVLTFETIKPC